MGSIQANATSRWFTPDQDRGTNLSQVGIDGPQLPGVAAGDVQLAVRTDCCSGGTSGQTETACNLLGGRIDGNDLVDGVGDDIDAFSDGIGQDDDRATAYLNLLEKLAGAGIQGPDCSAPKSRRVQHVTSRTWRDTEGNQLPANLDTRALLANVDVPELVNVVGVQENNAILHGRGVVAADQGDIRPSAVRRERCCARVVAQAVALPALAL